MAAKFGIPVCPHAGGVGLCRRAAPVDVDYLAVTGTMGAGDQYVDHLHEHSRNPVRFAAAATGAVDAGLQALPIREASRLAHPLSLGRSGWRKSEAVILSAHRRAEDCRRRFGRTSPRREYPESTIVWRRPTVAARGSRSK